MKPPRPSLVLLVLLGCYFPFLTNAQTDAGEPRAGAAQLAAPATTPIQDDSFLIEEGYNQEDGVVQHISYFQFQPQSGDWVYTQTDEWPLRSLKHQLSVTLSATQNGSMPGTGGGWGDAAVNYRYQLVGSGETKVAVAPRISLLVPSGNAKYGRGAGGAGLQTNLPISIQHSPRWVTNWNAGATWVPRAQDSQQNVASIAGVNLGQSVVWLAKPRVNFLVETIWLGNQMVTGPGKTSWQNNMYVSPGIRWAYNFRSGLQIVPGLGVPIGVGPSAGQRGLILYLSFEHPFGFSHSRRNRAEVME
jgi:hypothetical protein